MENLIKMDDLGVPLFFGNTQIEFIYVTWHILGLPIPLAPLS